MLSSFTEIKDEHAHTSVSEQLLDSIDITLSTAELRPNDDMGNLEDTSKVDGQGDDAGSMESNSSQQMIIRATR